MSIASSRPGPRAGLQRPTRPPRFLALVALASLVFATGCSVDSAQMAPVAPAPADAPASSQLSSAGASETPYPAAVSFEDAPLPKFTFRQYTLPAGCEVTDHTARIAAYSQNTWRSDQRSVFGLLDLSTGARRIVLAKPVNAALGYSAFSPRVSDSWFVWEEVSPNEGTEPSKATWRLYAAQLDTRRLAIGKPRLVDEGLTDYKPRPHYAVLGSTVVWTVNTIPSPRQEYVARSGSVMALDLATGRRRCVLRTSRSFPTLSASDGRIVVTEPVRDAKPGKAMFRVRAHVLDASGQALSPARDLGNTHAVAHFVQTSGDWLAWATFAQNGAEWPNLYLQASQGDVLLAGVSSIDPAFFGRYVAFESVEASFAGGSILRRARRIWVADPGQRTHSVLLSTTDEGWWQTCASGQAGDALLLWNDLGPWVEDPSTAKTVVRVYRSPD
jgi:hypothetical protein